MDISVGAKDLIDSRLDQLKEEYSVSRHVISVVCLSGMDDQERSVKLSAKKVAAIKKEWDDFLNLLYRVKVPRRITKDVVKTHIVEQLL
jgi:predicted transcriptional regulator